MAPPHRPTVAILSDQNLFRQGLTELLHRQGFMHVEAHTTSHSLLKATQVPAVLLVDLDHEQQDTMTLIRLLRRSLPTTRIVIIGNALRQEAAGSAKTDGRLETPEADAAALVAAVAVGDSGQSPEVLRQHLLWSTVTPRQRDVLRWLATGIDNQTIAHKLRIGERAVKAHLSTLLENFGVTNRTQLALIADHAGLRPPRTVAAG